jgi:hypothetical protein
MQTIELDTENIQANTDALRVAQTLERHQAIMQWLSPTDYPAQQNDIITRKQEGTGQWFLNSIKFKNWLRGSNNTLFCPGIPGAGKTMMSAIAIDHLCKTACSDSTGVAYLFCTYKTQGDQSDQSSLSLLAALLKQLVHGRLDMAAPVARIHEKHTQKNTRPSIDEIFGVLQTVCLKYAAVYIVVDALDELTDKEGARSQLLGKLDELQDKTDIHLMCTSRFYPEIMHKFGSSPELEIRASNDDIRSFVEGRMPLLPKCIQRDDELKHAVEGKIIRAVDGMYVSLLVPYILLTKPGSFSHVCMSTRLLTR